MRRGPAAKRRPRLAGVLLGLVATAAWGSSGVVMNPKGEPLEGVSVCYVVNNADGLCVSVKTVEAHRKQVMTKLGIHSVAELTKYAIRQGSRGLRAGMPRALSGRSVTWPPPGRANAPGVATTC